MICASSSAVISPNAAFLACNNLISPSICSFLFLAILSILAPWASNISISPSSVALFCLICDSSNLKFSLAATTFSSIKPNDVPK
jgi:hypothetical protein